MKKLIMLTFALLFTAGMAFGQVVDTEASGDNNTATAIQHWNNNSSMPISIFIDQSGNNNTATSLQNANGYSGVYLSTIDQSGNWNIANQTVVSSLGINAYISQSGLNTEAAPSTATQTIHYGVDDRASADGLPDNPSFSIIQGPGTHNTATQTIGKEGQLDGDLYATITQTGSDNTATQEMSGDDHWFNITQSGTGNTATMKVDDYHGAQGGEGHADIIQSGDDNTATALMHGSNRYNVDILQSGYSNTALVDIAAGLGALNTVSIEQNRTGATANVNITGAGNHTIVCQGSACTNI